MGRDIIGTNCPFVSEVETNYYEIIYLPQLDSPYIGNFPQNLGNFDPFFPRQTTGLHNAGHDSMLF